ncbi:T9SS type A sorting domain-containing protein [Halpernia frigidisoli]|nr:T9SS type A sorting domain-containing protein [Halpernia frigidisoli]
MKKHLLSVMVLCGSLINSQTYSNGNLSTGSTTSTGGVAPTGYTWSEVQAAAGNTTIGSSAIYNNSLTSNFRLADDFVVPAGQKWTITSVEALGYQTSSTTYPFDQINLRIWNGVPGGAGAIVFGDTTTNLLNTANSVDYKIYRIGNGTAATNRRIWKLSANVATSLNSGTFWVDFQAHPTNDASAFFPPVTIVGATGPSGANALQYNGTSWVAFTDGGSLAPQAVPFLINYTVATLSTTETRQYDSRLVIYPNPVKSSFKLSIPQESLNAKTDISIYDLGGRKVKSFKMAESYDISSLEKGVYLLKVNDGTTNKVTKIIKD